MNLNNSSNTSSNFLSQHTLDDINKKYNVLSDVNLLKLIAHCSKSKNGEFPSMDDKIIEDFINMKKNSIKNEIKKHIIYICAKCRLEMKLSNNPYLCFECFINEMNAHTGKTVRMANGTDFNIKDVKVINSYISKFFVEVDKLKNKFEMDDEEIMLMFSEMRKSTLWNSEKNMCKLFFDIFKNYDIIDNNSIFSSNNKTRTDFLKQNYDIKIEEWNQNEDEKRLINNIINNEILSPGYIKELLKFYNFSKMKMKPKTNEQIEEIYLKPKSKKVNHYKNIRKKKYTVHKDICKIRTVCNSTCRINSCNYCSCIFDSIKCRFILISKMKNTKKLVYEKRINNSTISVEKMHEVKEIKIEQKDIFIHDDQKNSKDVPPSYNFGNSPIPNEEKPNVNKEGVIFVRPF